MTVYRHLILVFTGSNGFQSPSKRKDVPYRRRIYTEEKAKVVAAVWGYRMFSYVVGEKPNVALVVLALFSAIF